MQPRQSIQSTAVGAKIWPAHAARRSPYSADEILVASCTTAIRDGEVPEWVELIPTGKFSAVDGRGPFENQDPHQVVAASVAKMPEAGLVLDYDHSTDLAAPEGRPAPAAGWLKQFKVENGAIFARVEWTEDAAAAVKAKKYRYVSPVFEHSKDGKVERILRAALTNNPALINLPALARSEEAGFLAQQPRAGMTPLNSGTGFQPVGVARMAQENADKKMKLSEVMAVLEEAYPDAGPEKLMKAAGCLMADDDDGDGDEPNGEEDDGMAAGDDPYQHEDSDQMAARQTDEMAQCASDEERSAMATKHAAEKKRFAKRVKGLEVQNRNEKMSAETLSHQIAKHPMVVKMASELNSMRAAQAKDAATQKVDAAIRDGRLIPSQREWAIEYASADSNGFDKFIGAQPKILQSGPDGTFTGRIGESKEEMLSTKELAVCANLGVSIDKFASAKKARLSHNVHLD